MAEHLVLTVRFHGDGQGTARFHGVAEGSPEWPPAPARLFQALVAGAACGNALPQAVVPALEWLEALPPPLIAAPRRQLGQNVSVFVPNNDADALSDPRDVSSLRVKKVVQPSLFADDEPLLYAWQLSGPSDHARTILAAADGVYQLGRGVDPAWAVGEVVADDAFEIRLQRYRGVVHRPELGARGGAVLACPMSGSLVSLLQRHRTVKLRVEGSGRKARVLFSNPPKPRFLSVGYTRARKRIVYELRARDDGKPWPWALGRAAKLVETLRDHAAARLRAAVPALAPQIEATLVGRKTHESDVVPVAERVRIVPLPSIGFMHADRAIRRFCLEMPSGAPLSIADLEWAFSGLEWAHPVTGEISPLRVTHSDDHDMLARYVVRSRQWRSVTAVALPLGAQRRRIEPARQCEEAKPASERSAEEDRAVVAVHTALRHAGIRAVAVGVRVQREPFERNGARAEVFAADTRFAKERLWHVELELDRPVEGPVVIGDGRFLGLGVMAPGGRRCADTHHEDRDRRLVRNPSSEGGVFSFLVSALETTRSSDQALPLARALRRATMARVQRQIGRQRLSPYFSGHHGDEGEGIAGEAGHLAFQWDGQRERLLVIAPHRLDRRELARHERANVETLERALEDLVELRAGAVGRFMLCQALIGPEDPLLAPSCRWISLTPYVVTKHRKCAFASDAIAADIFAECERRRLPRPRVNVLEVRGVSGRGLEGRVQLDFAVAVAGPIVLGRTRYLGGGMFTAEGAD